MKIGEQGSIEIYPQICCEICGEVVHNHLDCPVCGEEYARSDNYYNMYIEVKSYKLPVVLICVECGSKFKPTKTGGSLDEWIWERIE